MTPLEAIADLDALLATVGQDIKLRRITKAGTSGRVTFDLDCLGFPRGLKPEDIVDGVPQDAEMVVVSPTPIDAAGWTGSRKAPEDRRIPAKGDAVVIAGREKAVVGAKGIYMAPDVLVRINIAVKG